MMRYTLKEICKIMKAMPTRQGTTVQFVESYTNDEAMRGMSQILVFQTYSMWNSSNGFQFCSPREAEHGMTLFDMEKRMHECNMISEGVDA